MKKIFHKANLVKLSYIVSILSLSAFISLSAEAANDNINIVSNATKSISTFLKNDGRTVIDLGIIGSGGGVSLMKGTWTPVVASGIALAIFEILMGVVKV